MKPEIVFEEENIIICNKPPGVASQSDKTFETDLNSGILTYLVESGKAPYCTPINRLDKPVGGLVLFACDKKTASKLSAMTGEHAIEKYYYAVVKGVMIGKGEFVDYLIKEPRNNLSKVVSKDVKGSKKAILLYEALETKQIEGQDYTLLRIRLLTGRHHQIRVQLASREHCLYGDMKYNSEFIQSRGVFPALFAYKLSFVNPNGLPKITVEVEPKGSIWKFDILKKKNDDEL